MGKIVKDDWEFKVEKVEGEMQYSAHYTVVSEGVEQKRGRTVKLSAQQETQIADFLKSVVRPQVEAYETNRQTRG